MLNKKVTFLGAGNMGASLLRGALRSGELRAEDVTVVEIDAARAKALEKEFGVAVVNDPVAAIPGADILLIAVKPFSLGALLDQIRGVCSGKELLISIVAGVEGGYIRDRIGKDNPVVRVMPNLAATVDAAASAIAACPPADDAHLDLAERLFASVGEVVRVAESQLDAVTGLSGSGPAYIFLVLEALCDGGVQMGLAVDVARKLAVQTVLGAAKLVKESGEHPAVLKSQVTTPAGTTIAGLRVLENQAVHAAFMNAVEAASNRSRELGDAARGA